MLYVYSLQPVYTLQSAVYIICSAFFYALSKKSYTD